MDGWVGGWMDGWLMSVMVTPGDFGDSVSKGVFRLSSTLSLSCLFQNPTYIF